MLSSTSLDLPEHRKEVMDACLRQDIFPKAMEHLPARDADAVRVSLEMVDEADIYIGIYAWRYGHIPEGQDISITEMELNRAVERGIPILIFLSHALAELHRQNQEYTDARELLDHLWEPARRGPYPTFHADALNVLAQIERDEGDRDAAIAAARESFRLAWCDGPPYAYHYGLTQARQHLESLGAPLPALPPFDPAQFEPLPEVELNPDDAFHV